MNLRDATDADLVAEIERRKKATETKLPEKRSEPNWSGLLLTIDSGIAHMIECGYEDEDFARYVYEAAMGAVFVDYWAWKRGRGE